MFQSKIKLFFKLKKEEGTENREAFRNFCHKEFCNKDKFDTYPISSWIDAKRKQIYT